MKILVGAVILGLLITVTSGCGSVYVYDRHTAGKYDTVSRADGIGHGFVSSPSYDVLGPVSASGESTILLGLVADGKEGYGLLMNDARGQYNDDASTVMHIMADYEYSGILFPILGSIKTNYHGVAVKMNKVSSVDSVTMNTQ